MSTAIYLYGFINQILGLILGNIFVIIITACVPLTIDILILNMFTMYRSGDIFVCMFMRFSEHEILQIPCKVEMGHHRNCHRHILLAPLILQLRSHCEHLVFAFLDL